MLQIGAASIFAAASGHQLTAGLVSQFVQSVEQTFLTIAAASSARSKSLPGLLTYKYSILVTGQDCGAAQCIDCAVALLGQYTDKFQNLTCTDVSDRTGIKFSYRCNKLWLWIQHGHIIAAALANEEFYSFCIVAIQTIAWIVVTTNQQTFSQCQCCVPVNDPVVYCTNIVDIGSTATHQHRTVGKICIWVVVNGVDFYQAVGSATRTLVEQERSIFYVVATVAVIDWNHGRCCACGCKIGQWYSAVGELCTPDKQFFVGVPDTGIAYEYPHTHRGCRSKVGAKSGPGASSRKGISGFKTYGTTVGIGIQACDYAAARGAYPEAPVIDLTYH